MIARSELPQKGETVTREKLLAICALHGRVDLLRYILTHPEPEKPFTSDGCSCWFDTWGDVDMYPWCFFHDVWYWCGARHDEKARAMADAQLAYDVAKAGLPDMSRAMFNGVWLFGHEEQNTPYEWGYGRVA